MHPTLAALGLPELLEDPERLAEITDEQIDELMLVVDQTASILENSPDDEEAIDTIYLAHMTITSTFFMWAFLNDSQPQALPPASVLARSWKGSALNLVSKADIADMIVPTGTIEVLTSCGLPTASEPSLVFDPHPVKLLDVIDLTPDEAEVSSDFFATYWRIATTEHGDAMCLDERSDGTVVLLDAGWAFFAQQFVNTSVGHLLLCLEAYRVLDTDTSDDVDASIATLERAIERIDPVALTEGAFWPEILESMNED